MDQSTSLDLVPDLVNVLSLRLLLDRANTVRSISMVSILHTHDITALLNVVGAAELGVHFLSITFLVSGMKKQTKMASRTLMLANM